MRRAKRRRRSRAYVLQEGHNSLFGVLRSGHRARQNFAPLGAEPAGRQYRPSRMHLGDAVQEQTGDVVLGKIGASELPIDRSNPRFLEENCS